MKIPDINENEIEILAKLICSIAVTFGYPLRHIGTAQEILDQVKFFLARAVDEFRDMEETLEGGES